jgi:hypothetical protein
MDMSVRRSCFAVIVVLAVAASGCSKADRTAARTTPTPSASSSRQAASAAPCPLTNLPAPGGSVPNRPVLAVKVPNDIEQARGHQTGLNAADIVYEEPVEGGITRFIALYQCRDASRIEPVRSARFVDLDVLGQFGKVIFAHAGAINPVLSAIKSAVNAGQIIDADYLQMPYQGDYHRDRSLAQPDNLYTSTGEIYKTAGSSAGGPPTPVFSFLPASGVTVTAEAGAGPGSVLQVPFSGPSYNPTWTWSASSGTYLRSYGGAPADLTDGSQMAAANVVVMAVSVTPSQYVEDPTGAHENLVGTTGTGKAVVCRDGSCVTGTWARASTTAPIQYLDASSNPIPFQPGNTWVELEPNTQTPSFS